MIQGSIVALVTPMNSKNTIDYQALDNLIDFHLENGTNAIVSVGTTGESATLNVKEHTDVINFTIKKVNKRIPVIAGTGGNSTAESIDLTKEAKKLGADACLLVTPYYNKPTQEGLFQHYKAIANTVSIPQILYNVPSRTGVDILPETVLRISQFQNVIGIKEATGNLERAQKLLDILPKDFLIYSGDDATAFKLILMGGKGNISVTANILPKEMSDLCSLALQGMEKEASELNNLIIPLHNALFLESNPIPVKWALNKMNKIQNGIRLPLTILGQNKHEQLLNALKQLKVITK